MSELPARLFLVVPGATAPETAADCVVRACAAGDVACVLVRGPENSAFAGDAVTAAHRGEALARAVIDAARPAGVVVVVEDSVDLARRSGADGVHVTKGPREAAAVRRQMGLDAIVGGEVRGRRHEAMELGEAGIDYIAIDQQQEAGGENLLAWWAEMFVIPAVAIRPARPEEMAELVRRGANFVVPPAAMWEDAEAADRVVTACMAALREAS